MAKNKDYLKDKDGKSSDWIELFNSSDDEVDLAGYSLADGTGDKWFFPKVIIKPDSFLLIFASGTGSNNLSELHANFKVKASGELLTLFGIDGAVIDSITTGDMKEDHSEGNSLDGGNQWVVFKRPSAGESNAIGLIESDISFSHESGFYLEPFSLTITSTDSVYYTLDGSEPTKGSNLYTKKIAVDVPQENFISQIQSSHLEYDDSFWFTEQFGFRMPEVIMKKAVVLKVRSYNGEVATSGIYHKTYFVTDEEYDFDVISITLDENNLFDPDSGIYVPGVNHDESNPDWTGNYYKKGRDWERKAHFEYFEEGDVKFSSNIGLRITGQKSRSHPQKSLRLYFRESYGESNMNMSLFEERGFTEFKRLTLRSSFTYWNGRNCTFQDDFIHQFSHDNNFDIDVMHSRPSLVFINGEIWGLQNIRERQDKYYFNSLYGVDTDSLNLLAGNLGVEDGDGSEFIELKDFILTQDLKDEVNYTYVKSRLDISNYIDYFILEMYFGNADWPWNNLRIWKSNDNQSKWRYLLYDLDATMGDAYVDSFEKLDQIPDNVQVLIFRKLMVNDEFRESFLSRYLEHLKSSFNPQNTVTLFEEFEELYENDIGYHINRWNNPETYFEWEKQVQELKEFLEERPCGVKSMLEGMFLTQELGLFDCDYLAVNKLDDQSMSFIFPNPTKNVLRLTILDSSIINSSVRILNSSGVVVLERDLSDKYSVLDVSSLQNGLYYVNVRNEVFDETEKLLIE